MLSEPFSVPPDWVKFEGAMVVPLLKVFVPPLTVNCDSGENDAPLANVIPSRTRAAGCRPSPP